MQKSALFVKYKHTFSQNKIGVLNLCALKFECVSDWGG